MPTITDRTNSSHATSFAGLRVLVVDDEPDVRRGLEVVVGGLTPNVRSSPSAEEALTCAREWHPHVIVSDVMMSGASGIDLVRTVASESLDAAVILITGFGSIPTAVAAMQAGAVHFLTKPFDNTELLEVIRTHGRDALIRDEIRQLKSRKSDGDHHTLVGDSPPMRGVAQLIERVAASDATVLIEGESGTGKELVAQAIHARSTRSDKPMIAVNTAALPESLVESELFGHVRGAFTGATDPRRGIFRDADGGTVFLDEIALMPAAMQGKLLRVLQEHAVIPLGTSQQVPADFRLIAATNRNLLAMADAGEFREDLYYRLQVVTIRVPPLRERKADIPALVTHFLAQLERQACINHDALDSLMQHDWPGNVRELRNCIERAVILAGDDEIGSQHLHLSDQRRSDRGRAAHTDLQAAPPNWPHMTGEIEDYELAKRSVVEAFQRQYIEQALTRSGGNISHAAQACGLTRAAFRSIMRSLGIKRDDFA